MQNHGTQSHYLQRGKHAGGLHPSFFFLQAEDGLRYDLVTGVKTCALPILFAVGRADRSVGQAHLDQVMIVPMTTVQVRLPDASIRTTNGEYTVSSVHVKVNSEKEMASAQAQIEQLLMQRHGIKQVADEDFRVVSQQQILTSVNNTTSLITLFLGVIAGISLLVGGIGVMNIMLVSVTERTREIGLRKAVGARYFDLMTQFLIESVALSVGGGLVGILVGALIAFIGGRVIQSLTLTITVPAILLATGVSTAIGIFFGLYPASRAATLSPMEALRYE